MQLDLNLLTALDALLEEGSVTGAADRLQLTAPAVSRALGRLRRVTGDQILVRTGRTMTLTPRALAMRAEVHRLVQQAHAVLAPDPELELGTLERTFTLQAHDAITHVIGPGLLAAVREQAPGVRLRVLAEAPTDTSELRHGQVDLAISAARPNPPDVRHERATQDRLVVAVGPRSRVGATLTLDQYVAADHVTVSRRGRLRDPVDDLLAARGLTRRVVAAVPTSTAALRIAQHGDVLVAVPAHIASPLADGLGLRLLPLPFDTEPVPVYVAWHQRYDDDRAHAWLRGLVRAALREATGSDGPPATGPE
ncbi:LysR family transcriptional regulator [Streptomyces sp. NPDC057702]|uniref:LysR family transcriptional regulator n=1 Tax=unclassified Streptomyces TaxID=2593676 RepID=UPI0036B28A7E